MILQMVKVTGNKKYMLLEYKLSHSVNKAYSFGILFPYFVKYRLLVRTYEIPNRETCGLMYRATVSITAMRSSGVASVKCRALLYMAQYGHWEEPHTSQMFRRYVGSASNILSLKRSVGGIR